MRLIANIDIKNHNIIKGIQLEGLRVVGEFKKLVHKIAPKVDEMILHDSVASYYYRPNLIHLVKENFKKIFLPLTIGGGIKSYKDVKQSLSNGADKVMINSAAIKNPNFLNIISKKFGSSTLISYIEVKKIKNEWIVYFNNGRQISKYNLVQWLKIVEQKGCGEIFIKNIDRDGTMHGIDFSLVEICEKYSNKPLIFAGGCKSFEEINKFKKNFKNSSLAIGQLLYKSLQITKYEKKNYNI